jgi:hypothetical protein
MPAARWDLHIEQGSTYSKPIRIKVSGLPFDLTDWTPSGQIRKTHRSADIIANFTFDCPTTGTNPDTLLPWALTDGAMTIIIAAAVTATIACGELETDPKSKYVYDIELTGTGTHANDVKRLMEGYVFVSPEVTRDE